MSRDQVVLAVDGGNSKTDLALVRADGEVLALARGPLSSPHHLGLDGALDVLQRLLDQASREAGRARDGTGATIAQLLMAGVDFPSEEEELRAAVAGRGWAERTHVGNDTFAVLRAGTERGWGVAVVCGAGINCAGRSADGRVARYPSLGWESGDWGGSVMLGREVLFLAARAEDGRGERAPLRRGRCTTCPHRTAREANARHGASRPRRGARCAGHGRRHRDRDRSSSRSVFVLSHVDRRPITRFGNHPAVLTGRGQPGILGLLDLRERFLR